MCRYFLNGECWRQDKCKFLHDGAKKIKNESIPLCKNGVNCSFLARGICNFSHRKVGVQNKRIFINLNKPSPPPARNFPQNNNHDSRPSCKFLEDCIRAPHCNFKHYDEVFPKLPKTNNPGTKTNQCWGRRQNRKSRKFGTMSQLGLPPPPPTFGTFLNFRHF